MFTKEDFETLIHDCPALRLSKLLVGKEVTEDNVEVVKEALDYLERHEEGLRVLRQNIVKKLRDYNLQSLMF